MISTEGRSEDCVVKIGGRQVSRRDSNYPARAKMGLNGARSLFCARNYSETYCFCRILASASP